MLRAEVGGGYPAWGMRMETRGTHGSHSGVSAGLSLVPVAECFSTAAHLLPRYETHTSTFQLVRVQTTIPALGAAWAERAAMPVATAEGGIGWGFLPSAGVSPPVVG